MYWQRVAAHVSIMYLRMREIMVEDRNGLLEILNQFVWEQIIKSSYRVYDFNVYPKYDLYIRNVYTSLWQVKNVMLKTTQKIWLNINDSRNLFHHPPPEIDPFCQTQNLPNVIEIRRDNSVMMFLGGWRT